MSDTADEAISRLTEVLAAVESGIAEIAECMDKIKDGGAEVRLGLDGLAEGLERIAPQRLDDLVAAIKAMAAPQVHVSAPPAPAINMECNIPPPPAPVLHFLPSTQEIGATWRVQIQAAPGRPERVMTITRTK